MSDASRTQKPTPKRVKDFRKRGEIAVSRDLTAALTLSAGVAGAALGGATTWAAFCALARTGAGGGSLEDVVAAARQGFLLAVAPILAAALVGCVVGGGLQLGWPPAFRRPGFDPSRWLSFGGVKEVLSPSAMTRRLLIAVAKVLVVGAVVAFIVRNELDGISAHADAHAIASRLRGAVLKLAALAVGAVVALAVVDYVLSRRRLANKMKMTSDEVRREHREQEGDPAVKGRRRRRMRELARRRLVAETRKADVVLVNPTHFAVALRYDATRDGAPRVVAKGTDEVATRIREAARAGGVPVLSRPPLARALHKLVPEGQEVPPQLFQAVAEVLAYIYRLRARRGGAAS